MYERDKSGSIFNTALGLVILAVMALSWIGIIAIAVVTETYWLLLALLLGPIGLIIGLAVLRATKFRLDTTQKVGAIHQQRRERAFVIPAKAGIQGEWEGLHLSQPLSL